MQTRDLSDQWFVRLKEIAGRLEASPLDMMRVMYAEANCRADAHNPNGNASGLIQFMPATLERLGWTRGHAAFRKLNAIEQLPFVERYYRPYVGHLGSVAGLYVATFLPAYVKHAGDPYYVLVAKDPPVEYVPDEGDDYRRFWESIMRLQPEAYASTLAEIAPKHPSFYEPNKGLDANRDYLITVGEMEQAVQRACKGARWNELVARLTGTGASGPDDIYVEIQHLDPKPMAGLASLGDDEDEDESTNHG